MRGSTKKKKFYSQIIHMRPKSKDRPRMSKAGHAYTTKATREYEKAFAAEYKGPYFAEGPLRVKLIFNIHKTVIVIEQITELLEKSELRGDIDNYAKSVLDALNGVAFKDDKQVIVLELEKT